MSLDERDRILTGLTQKLDQDPGLVRRRLAITHAARNSAAATPLLPGIQDLDVACVDTGRCGGNWKRISESWLCAGLCNVFSSHRVEQSPPRWVRRPVRGI